MKNSIIVSIALILTAVPSIAADISWGSVTGYTSTKADKTVPVSASEPIRIITSASTCTAHVTSSSNTGAPIPANTFVDIHTPSNIANVIFKCTSSAGTTVYVIK